MGPEEGMDDLGLKIAYVGEPHNRSSRSSCGRRRAKSFMLALEVDVYRVALGGEATKTPRVNSQTTLITAEGMD
jgi:hypothetical protein